MPAARDRGATKPCAKRTSPAQSDLPEAGLLLLWLAAAACTPEIIPGAYLCGREQMCPEDQACNGPDQTCVLANQAQPFACGATTEHEPNDAPTAPEVVADLGCISAFIEIKGCSSATSDEDWFQFDVPGNCSAVAVSARLIAPVAFAPLTLALLGSDGSTVAAAVPCSDTPDDDHIAHDELCLRPTLTAGARYTLGVAQQGLANCGGACAHNRYTLTVQLVAP
jgi:hypothetical protein